MNEYELNRFRAIMVLIFLLTFATETICQITRTDSIKNPLEMFEGDWILKKDKWKSSFDCNYSETILPNIIFSAQLVDPKNTLRWYYDFKNGFQASVLWVYDEETEILYDLSNNSYNHIGSGSGKFDEKNDLRLKIQFRNLDEKQYTIYQYHWISPDEFDLKATNYNDDSPTGDFYGGTFVRKVD